MQSSAESVKTIAFLNRRGNWSREDVTLLVLQLVMLLHEEGEVGRLSDVRESCR